MVLSTATVLAVGTVQPPIKKMNDSNMAVEKGGKPLLDSNSMSHLKNLLDDAMDKGDLQQDEIDGIADEADRMGEDYLNDDHKASIDAANDKQRAHHEDFLAHAEGMSEEALQRKGHDLDHSKAHELHHYEEDEEGNLKRTGSSHSYRDEDGSVKRLDTGDHVNIPAHTKHRVSWTDPEQETIWLAVFYQ